jgi:hypothetical protein
VHSVHLPSQCCTSGHRPSPPWHVRFSSVENWHDWPSPESACETTNDCAQFASQIDQSPTQSMLDGHNPSPALQASVRPLAARHETAVGEVILPEKVAVHTLSAHVALQVDHEPLQLIVPVVAVLLMAMHCQRPEISRDNLVPRPVDLVVAIASLRLV